jgi:hypothetical protein
MHDARIAAVMDGCVVAVRHVGGRPGLVLRVSDLLSRQGDEGVVAYHGIRVAAQAQAVGLPVEESPASTYRRVK